MGLRSNISLKAVAILVSMIVIESAFAQEQTEPDAQPAVKSQTQSEVESEAEQSKLAWRKDPQVLRRPGSYLGGGLAYSMSNAWYTVKLRDFVQDYDMGPVHGYMTFVRVGDAFREWIAVGFQLDLIAATLAGQDSPGASAFGLYVDATFYPWRGLGLRPSVGVGFGYAQAGKETHELGFGGPLSLSFSASYEFRVSRRGLTMGPMIQVSWVKGEDFDAVFFNVALEILKWFRTAQG